MTQPIDILDVALNRLADAQSALIDARDLPNGNAAKQQAMGAFEAAMDDVGQACACGFAEWSLPPARDPCP